MVHGGRAFNLQAPPPPPPQEGIILPPPRPTSDAAGRIFLLFVDDLHLDFRNTGRIRDLFKKIANTLIHEGDMFGIVSTGPSSIAIDLTYDRKRLDEAIKKIAGNGTEALGHHRQGPESAEGPERGPLSRARGVLDGLRHRCRTSSRVQNRRKAVIYVSNGYDFNPFPEGRLADSQFGGAGGRLGEDGERADNPFLPARGRSLPKPIWRASCPS